MDAKGVLTVCVNDPKTNTCVAPYHLTADKNPPKVDAGGFGLRVPGIVISPWAKKGTTDKQVMSHDAYLRFIEDLFLDGARIDPSTDGRRDSRPTVRENLQPGDLMNDFDFTQKPLPPLVPRIFTPHPHRSTPTRTAFHTVFTRFHMHFHAR